MDHPNGLLCRLDPAGRVLSSRGAWEPMLGWTREPLSRLKLWELAHPRDAETLLRAIRDTNARGRVCEVRILAREGGYRWTRWRMVRRPDRTIDAAGCDVSVLRDIG